MPIKLIRHDITKINCDAIVSPENHSCIAYGGTSLAIQTAGGEKLRRECEKLGRISSGESKITKAYDLPCKYVIHTAGPVWQGGEKGEEIALINCYRSSLELAKKHHCKSVAFPLISSGRYGYPKESVLRVAVDTVSRFLENNEMLVYIVVYDKASFSVSQKLFSDVTSYITDNYVDSVKRMKLSTFLASSPMPSCEKSMSRAREALPESISLDDMLEKMDKGFAETLFYYIDKKGVTDVECYKMANVDKKTFSKIKCNKHYKPSKVTVVSFAIGLRLNIEETNHLLRTVGMSLSRSNKFDVIIEYFITSGNYSTIFDVNETLYQFDQVTLGV